MRTLAPELQDIYVTLINEGREVYTSTYSFMQLAEITTLTWYENNRVLSIMRSSWHHERYNRNSFIFVTEYHPDRENGSSCSLSPDNDGMHPDSLLKYRHEYTWTKGIPYANMEAFLKDHKHYHKVEEVLSGDCPPAENQ